MALPRGGEAGAQSLKVAAGEAVTLPVDGWREQRQATASNFRVAHTHVVLMDGHS